jgi:hypothetical protein
MAIAYKSAGAGTSTETNGANLTPACPAVVAAGDILIAHIVVLDATSALSTPDGWTLLFGPSGLGTGTPTGRAWAYGRIADGTEDGATVNFGSLASTVGRLGRIYSFDGRVSGTITQVVPAASFGEDSSETDPVITSVTTTVAGSKAVSLVSQDDDNAHDALGAVTGGTWAEPVADYLDTTVGAQGACLQLQVGTPSSDPGTIAGGTVAGTNDEANTLNFEIRPSPPAHTATGALTLPATTVSGAAALSGFGAFPDAVMALSPDGYWRLEETSGTNAADLTGTQDGTYIGTPTLDVTGIDGNNAVTLTGGTMGISVADNAAWDLGTGDFTVMWAMKRSGTWPAAAQFLFGHDGDGGAGSFGSNLQTGNAGVLELRFESTAYTVTTSPTTLLSDDAWHLCFWVVDRSGNAELWVDGVSEGTVAVSGSSAVDLTNIRVLYLGRRAAGNGFIGSLDEVAIWKGVLLSSTEIGDIQATLAAGHTSTGALSLPATTVAGTAEETVAATGALVLPAATVSGAGDSSSYTSTGALVLAATVIAGTGTESLEATGALTTPAVVISGTAEETFSASGAVVTQPIVIGGAAQTVIPLTATGALSLAAIVIAGTATETFTSTGDLTLPTVTVIGTGTETLEATGALIGQPVTVNGSARHGDVTGTGALVLAATVIDGDGEFTSNAVSASGALTLAATESAGTAEETLAATGSVTLQASTVAGTGEETHAATGALTFLAPTLDGTAAIAYTATGALTLGATDVAGSAETLPVLTATGSIVVGGVEIAGVGDNGAFVPPIPSVGRRRRPVAPVTPALPALTATGAISLPAVGVAGSGRQWDDDLWLYIEPALYLAGVT